MKPHFQLPNFIRPQIQNHSPLIKKKLIPTEGGRFTACSMLSRQTQTLQGAVVSCLFTVSVLSGGSYTSVLHAGSLLVAKPYLALSWDPWVLVAYATDQRLLWDLLENINSEALIQKGVFWKCASNCPRKFLHLWYRLGIAERKQWLHISFLSDSNLPLKRDSKIAEPCQGTVTCPVTYFERLWFSKWPLCFVITKHKRWLSREL